MRSVFVCVFGVFFLGAVVKDAYMITMKAPKYPLGQEPCIHATFTFLDDPDHRILPMWNCPEEIKITEQNLHYLYLVFALYFAATEGRGPATAEEVDQSVYNLIPFQQLKNPYFHRPIQFTTTPTPGDFTFEVRESPYSRWVEIGTWVKDPDPNYPDRLLYMDNSYSYYEYKHKHYEQTGNLELFRTGSDMDKKIYALNWILFHGGRIAYTLLTRPAADLEEFKQVYYWAEFLKNPYTGAPVQFVSHKVASPGDCTYYVERFYWDPEAKELKEVPLSLFKELGRFTSDIFLEVFCYNDQHKAVGSFGHLLKTYLESNEITQRLGLGVQIWIP
ncbi:MAG: hypothetical protein V2G48_08025 [bacterium JZ-2024 1]